MFDWKTILVMHPVLDEDVHAVMEGDPRIVWHRRFAEEDDVRDADMVIEDTEDMELATRIAGWCRIHGKPLNAVDKNEFCDLYYTSFVFRGPLVIAISSQGEAPALSVQLRKYLERKVGHGWTFAANLLGRLRRRLPGGQARKDLLRSITRSPEFLDAVEQNDLQQIRAIIEHAVCRLPDRDERSIGT